MISFLGVVFTLLIAAGVVFRRDSLPWVLSAAFAFLASSGFLVAGQSIVVYYGVAIVMIVLAVVRVRLRNLLLVVLRTRTGLTSLLVFALWTLLVTLVGPTLFAGTPVLNPREGLDQGVAEPALLTPHISNFAQSAYLLIGVATVVVLGTGTAAAPRLPATGFALGTVLSSTRSLLPESVQREVFDNSSNVTYTTGSIDGVERMRGIFSEPSGLGAFSVTAAVFFVMTASRTTGWPRYLSLGMSVWALVNASLSGSGTALVGGLALLAVIAAQAVYTFLSGHSRVSPSALVGTVLAVPVGMIVGPALYLAATDTVDDKVTGSSYANRSSADRYSVELSLDTYGVGVGLGSHRPSSFVAMMLACTGVLGLVFFVVAVTAILRGAVRDREFQPAAWALVSLLFSKIVAGPDLSDPTMWFLLAVCANAAWRPGRCPAVPVGASRIAVLDG